MPDATAASEIAPWLQAGGVLGFAGLVYMELRAHRADLRELTKLVVRASKLLAILLDRRSRAPTGPVAVVDDENGGDDAPT